VAGTHNNYYTARWLAAAQCIVIGPVCGFVYMFVGLLLDPHQTGFVGKDSDHLQLIKFWPSMRPGKGVCGGAKIFGSAILQPACSVCVSLGAFFIHYLFFITHKMQLKKYRALSLDDNENK